MATITEIKTYRVHGTVRPELAMVSAAGEHVVSHYVVVSLTDSEGLVGWGEATVTPVWSGETAESAEAIVLRHFAPKLIGREAQVTEAIGVMEKAAIGNPFAKAAIEMALWDIQGQRVGKPIWQLLSPNATPHPIPLRGSIAGVSPEGAVARAQWFLEKGLRACKVKVGVGGEKADIARVRAVREALGPDIPLGIDANAGWSVEEAVTVAKALEGCNLQYVEQPTARGDFLALRAVRDRIGVPVMADELVWTAQDVEMVLFHDAADIVSVYPGKMGGLWVCRKIAERLAEAGKVVYIGSNLERDIGTAAMAHLAVGLPGADFPRFHSDLVGTLYHTESIGNPPLSPINGTILPPLTPGLGVSYSISSEKER